EAPIISGPVAVGAADHPISAASRFAASRVGSFACRVQGTGDIVAAFALGMTFALSVTSGADLLREDEHKRILWLCVFASLAVLGLIAQLIDYSKQRRERASAESFPDAGRWGSYRARRSHARSRAGLDMECSTTPYLSPPLNERQGARRGREPGAAGSRARQEVGSEELDALRQRQLPGVVDRVRGLPHIGLPRVGAGFASAAGLLLTAEGTADLRSRGADVDVGDAAVRSRDEPLGFGELGGEDRRGQPLRDVVVDLECLVEIRIGHDIEAGGEGRILHHRRL